MIAINQVQHEIGRSSPAGRSYNLGIGNKYIANQSGLRELLGK